MLDLEPIRARAEKATKGPWEARGQMHVWSFCNAHTDCHHVNKVSDLAYHAAGGFEQTKADSQFIAHSREDIPALIAEVEQLRAKVERAVWQNVPHSPFDKLEGKICRYCWAEYPLHNRDCPAAERGEE